MLPDRFAHLACLQLQVAEGQIFISAQDNTIALKSLEADLFDLQCIDAWLLRREGESAVFIGGDGSHTALLITNQRNFGAGNHGAINVSHRPRNCSGD